MNKARTAKSAVEKAARADVDVPAEVYFAPVLLSRERGNGETAWPGGSGVRGLSVAPAGRARGSAVPERFFERIKRLEVVQAGGVYDVSVQVRNSREFPLDLSAFGQLDLVWVDRMGREVSRVEGCRFGGESLSARWKRVSLPGLKAPDGSWCAMLSVSIHDPDGHGGSIWVRNLGMCVQGKRAVSMSGERR
jgi:hypothetical protein